jgi:hypothetical protein
MKKLLILSLTMLLFSCSNKPFAVEDSQKATTIEVLNALDNDTTCVKIVEIDDTLYVVKDNLVTHKIRNQSGVVDTLGLIIIILISGIFLIIDILSN